MRVSFFLFTLFFVVLSLPAKAHAIIILPAVVLIPIAKIVAVVIGGFSFPVLGMSALWSKTKKKPIIKGIYIGIFLLTLLAAFLVISLRFIYPERPLF